MSGLRGAVALLFLAAGAWGCIEAEASSALAYARSSREALVQAVLEALETGDGEAAQRFLLTREEYETLLRPKLPDGEYTPFDFVWSLAEVGNRKGLRQALSEYGGMSLELVSISYKEEPEVYPSFTLHPGAQVRVRRTDTGEEGILPSFDVLVEHGGGWKLMNLDEL